MLRKFLKNIQCGSERYGKWKHQDIPNLHNIFVFCHGSATGYHSLYYHVVRCLTLLEVQNKTKFWKEAKNKFTCRFFVDECTERTRPAVFVVKFLPLRTVRCCSSWGAGGGGSSCCSRGLYGMTRGCRGQHIGLILRGNSFSVCMAHLGKKGKKDKFIVIYLDLLKNSMPWCIYNPF